MKRLFVVFDELAWLLPFFIFGCMVVVSAVATVWPAFAVALPERQAMAVSALMLWAITPAPDVWFRIVGLLP